MDPGTAALVFAAGTAASAGSQIMQGQAQSDAARFEQQQLQSQQKQYETAAAQDETQRRNDLTSRLETISAIRAGRGVGSASPTGMAIFDNLIDRSETDINTSRTNILTKADNAGMEAGMAGNKASTSLLAGYLGAASTVGSAAFKYNAATSYGRTKA